MIEMDGQYMLFEDNPNVLHLTEDEITSVLCGCSAESKRRIQDFVMRVNGVKADAAFIRGVYGICGWSHAIEGRDGIFLDATARGIRLSEYESGRERWLTWEDVARRIELLVKMGQYVEV